MPVDWNQLINAFQKDWPYLPDRNGKCPWCGTATTFRGTDTIDVSHFICFFATHPTAGSDLLSYRLTSVRSCCCGHPVVSMMVMSRNMIYGPYMLWPRAMTRPPVPREVPDAIRQDYEEAALVLANSPKASAALSRRCLQTVLREHGMGPGKLSAEIKQALPSLPEHIRANLHAFREAGNLAAHITKDEHTAEIVDVEPIEAEWTLDILDRLFDHYYVGPEQDDRRRREISNKLVKAGRKPLPGYEEQSSESTDQSDAAA